MDERSSRPHLVFVMSNEESAALIDAWVRGREAQILEEVALSFERLYWKLDGAVDAAKCVRAFATARKQPAREPAGGLEGKS
jgi:hypothetical protein